MTYKVFLLDKKESKNPMCCGYKYAFKNKDRWYDVNITSAFEHMGSYDVSKTSIVKDGVVYTIYKDFILIDENIRVYICQARDLENDRIKESTEEEKTIVRGY